MQVALRHRVLDRDLDLDPVDPRPKAVAVQVDVRLRPTQPRVAARFPAWVLACEDRGIGAAFAFAMMRSVVNVSCSRSAEDRAFRLMAR